MTTTLTGPVETSTEPTTAPASEHTTEHTASVQVQPAHPVGFDESRLLRRGAALIGLLSIAAIHLLLVNGDMHEVPWVAVADVVLIVACLALAEALIRSDSLLVWLATGAFAGGTAFGFCMSRMVGLPGDHGRDLTNWLEPAGMVSLLAEGVVVIIVLARLADRRTH